MDEEREVVNSYCWPIKFEEEKEIKNGKKWGTKRGDPEKL
jgi:hypothetical protein